MEMKKQQQKELEEAKERLNVLSKSLTKPLENAYGSAPAKQESENAGEEEEEGEWTYQTDQSIVTETQEQRPGPPPALFSESEYVMP